MKTGVFPKQVALKSIAPLLVALVLNALWLPPAHAQRFFPVRPPDPRSRLQLANYWSQWELDPGFRIPGVNLRRETEASLLTAADYWISDRFAVGGWWNPIRALDTQTGFPAEPPLPHVINRLDSKLWDVHLIYAPSGRSTRGWSVQLGYATFEFHLVQAPEWGGGDLIGAEHSPNIWVSRAYEIGGRRLEREYYPVNLFVSAGYFTASTPLKAFDHSASILVGGAINLSPSLTLGGSVWFFNLQQHNVLVRGTVGLVGSF
jgi:hypothetical protein